MRLLIDTQEHQDANNVFLPQTSSDNGVPATGGSIRVDSLTTYAPQKGKAVFDLSQLSYPYSVYSVALVKTSGTVIEVFNGATENPDNEWVNATEAIQSLLSDLSAPLTGNFNSLSAVQDGDNLVIQTDIDTRDENGVEFTLYINNGVKRTYDALEQGQEDNVGTTYTIGYDQAQYSVSATYTNMTRETLMRSLSEAYNGETITSGADFQVSSVDLLPAELKAAPISNGIAFYKTTDAITSISITFDAEFPLPFPASSTVKVEDVQTITGGEDRSTTGINFAIGSSTLVALTRPADFDITTTKLQLMATVRDKINALADFTTNGVKLVATETISIYALTAGGLTDNLDIVFNGQTVTLVSTSNDKATLLNQISTEIGNNFTAITSVVDTSGNEPVLKITADGSKDLGNGLFNLASDTSTYSKTAGGSSVTTFAFNALLSLATVQPVNTYNDLTISFNLAGDGSILTSAASAMTGGGSLALTSMLRTVNKSRGCVFEGASDTTVAGLNISGFGGFVMLGEEPSQTVSQNDIFSLPGNRLEVNTNNGIGWSVKIQSIDENSSFFVATFPLAAGNHIEDDPGRIFAIEIERVGSTCNFFLVRFADPLKTEAEGWKVQDRDQLGSLPYSAGATYRFMYLNADSEEAFIYNISNEVYVMNKVIIDATLAYPLNPGDPLTTTRSLKELLGSTTWTLPHILANAGSKAKLTQIRAEGN